MQIKLTLQLPRDEVSVPVVRRILAQSMTTVGVSDDCIEDIKLALTEACTNVLNHTVDGDDYFVTAGIEQDLCVIEVIDAGHGFDSEMLGLAEAEPTAEQGRGLQLLRALTDAVRFESRPEKGTIVHFEKRLVWADGALATRLALK